MIQALDYGKAWLVEYSDSPDIDAQFLLSHVLQCNLTYLHTWPHKLLTYEQITIFSDFIAQRITGKPVAYIVGERGFWSLNLKVTEATLIPRPDTELLVSLALEKIQPAMQIADLGTGSGAIALSLAQERSDITVLATDYSKSALKVAKENAAANQLSNVSFWQGSWLDGLQPNTFDLIISNPPYIEANDPHLIKGDVRFEPRTALASGADGLDDIRLIVSQSVQCLRAGGWLMIEHGYHQSEQVTSLFIAAGFSHVTAHQDFGGQDRVVIGQVTL